MVVRYRGEEGGGQHGEVLRSPFSVDFLRGHLARGAIVPVTVVFCGVSCACGRVKGRVPCGRVAGMASSTSQACFLLEYFYTE